MVPDQVSLKNKYEVEAKIQDKCLNFLNDISFAGVLLLPTSPATPAATPAEFWLSHPGSASMLLLNH